MYLNPFTPDALYSFKMSHSDDMLQFFVQNIYALKYKSFITSFQIILIPISKYENGMFVFIYY